MARNLDEKLQIVEALVDRKCPVILRRLERNGGDIEHALPDHVLDSGFRQMHKSPQFKKHIRWMFELHGELNHVVVHVPEEHWPTDVSWERIYRFADQYVATHFPNWSYAQAIEHGKSNGWHIHFLVPPHIKAVPDDKIVKITKLKGIENYLCKHYRAELAYKRGRNPNDYVTLEKRVQAMAEELLLSELRSIHAHQVYWAERESIVVDPLTGEYEWSIDSPKRPMLKRVQSPRTRKYRVGKNCLHLKARKQLAQRKLWLQDLALKKAFYWWQIGEFLSGKKVFSGVLSGWATGLHLTQARAQGPPESPLAMPVGWADGQGKQKRRTSLATIRFSRRRRNKHRSITTFFEPLTTNPVPTPW